VEVPDITFKPTLGEVFLHPSIDCVGLCNIMTYNDNIWCKFLSENDLCYPYTEEGRAAAKMHARAMLGIKE
jgi:hypothetical protein